MAFSFNNSIAAPVGGDMCSSHNKFYSGMSVPTVEENELLVIGANLQYIVGEELTLDGDLDLDSGAEVIVI